MNLSPFALTADILHDIALVVLFLKYIITGSCQGISGKSQILYFLVYVTRYLDVLDTAYYGLMYIFVMKLMYICITAVSIGLIYIKFRKINSHNEDTFHAEILVVACLLLLIPFYGDYSNIPELAWLFSIFLEAVAILPQMHLISKTWKADMYVVCYLILLGSYRTFYVMKWVSHYYSGSGNYENLIKLCAGIVQSTVYVVFFMTFIVKNCSKIQPRKPCIFYVYNIVDGQTKRPCDVATISSQFKFDAERASDQKKSDEARNVDIPVEDTMKNVSLDDKESLLNDKPVGKEKDVYYL